MVSVIELIGLAGVDAINPCALAVMVIVLMSLLVADPDKKRNVLLGGLSFTLAVYILYFLYGLIMIQFFAHLIPKESAFYSSIVFQGFGVIAIILGLLNMRDYFDYKPGGIATEMPIKLRPIVKKIIKGIETPRGAFFTGIIVTLFLLPCTIGPYIIFSGDVSVSLSFLESIPWLLLYNLIFVAPMIAITMVIYLGLTTVEKVSGWKEKNIKYLHLAEGLILIVLGIMMYTSII